MEQDDWQFLAVPWLRHQSKAAIPRREFPHRARMARRRLRRVGIDTKQEESDIEAGNWERMERC